MVVGAPQLEETSGRRRGQPPVAARAPLASPGEGKRGNLTAPPHPPGTPGSGHGCAREDHVWFEDWWMVASLCDE
jgi:hypothetical protein